VVKDGPVRAIIRNGRVQAYGSMISWSNTYTIPTTPIDFTGDIQLSLDFLPAIEGANFYNEAVPAGVVVDGEPDTVPEQPFSPWIQLSTDFGTLIQVVDTTQLSGSSRNFYIDDNSLDLQDTGDRRHYGEAGIYMDDPGAQFVYDFNLYILTGKQQNRGAEFNSYYSEPLAVETIQASINVTTTHTIFIPTVQR
jgi:hypothetical protein